MHICITGPESSGKTALSRRLAEALERPVLTEASREYLSSTDYLPSDLLAIAQLHVGRERSLRGAAVLDTDLQVVCLWWQDKFGPLPAELSAGYAEQTPRFYLLCYPDLPWQPDPLRENPHDRDRLFELYERDLNNRQLDYAVVRGRDEARLTCALDAVQRIQPD